MITVEIPGSKSLTNRALIIASLTKGRSIIEKRSQSRDSIVMVEGLKKLGVRIVEKQNKLLITGNRGVFKPFNSQIDVNDTGTAYRFLTALSCLVPGGVKITGSKRLLARPIEELRNALSRVHTGKVVVDGAISSQFISALLMIAPCLKNGLSIIIKNKLVSKSYVDMTIDLMEKFGVKVVNEKYEKLIVKKGLAYKAIDYKVEGDASGASYFWGIAAVTGKRIRVGNIDPLSFQGDVKFPDILEKMGCIVKKNVDERSIEVESVKNLKNINVNMSLMPDTAQTLAVVAAFAKGKTRITGLSTLKVKETDRLMALSHELGKIGIKSKITNDSIEIEGGRPKGATIETYSDHRMAMAFAVASARIPGIVIGNPEVVEKSFPEFWDKFKSLKINQ